MEGSRRFPGELNGRPTRESRARRVAISTDVMLVRFQPSQRPPPGRIKALDDQIDRTSPCAKKTTPCILARGLINHTDDSQAID
jgi:hypothetical protein